MSNRCELNGQVFFRVVGSQAADGRACDDCGRMIGWFHAVTCKRDGVTCFDVSAYMEPVLSRRPSREPKRLPPDPPPVVFVGEPDPIIGKVFGNHENTRRRVTAVSEDGLVVTHVHDATGQWPYDVGRAVAERLIAAYEGTGA